MKNNKKQRQSVTRRNKFRVVRTQNLQSSKVIAKNLKIKAGQHAHRQDKTAVSKDRKGRNADRLVNIKKQQPKTSRYPINKNKNNNTKTVKSPAAIRKEAAAAAEQAAINLKETQAVNKARTITTGAEFLEFISKNVGTRANDIIDVLLAGPCVDDKISESLTMKLNETRRMLNMLNTYGIVRYNINKNNEGWLSFIWYLDYDAVDMLGNKVTTELKTQQVLPENCNDFFVCMDCSEKTRMVLPFELAFEAKFKCSCGKNLTMINKEQAEHIYMAAAHQ